MKILLTSVFGPYGVDDEFGRRLNVMELFHNQVTREQGIFSLRMNHPSFGLYLIAENIEAPTLVLDFPSLDGFKNEIMKGYDYIGISFIVANFKKAQHMCQLIRKYSPQTKIILGGHGTGIKKIEEKIDCDYISKGDGVAWFRQLLNEDLNKPIKNPAIYSALQRRVMGLPVASSASVLIPGLGCVNACSFCATSHHFQKRYIGYMQTGADVFASMLELEKKLGVNEFFVLDENFLKHKPRAEELLELMKKHDKFFHLGVFSSAETISYFGAEFMASLGIDFVWVGIESKESVFAKTQGVDLKKMIKDLRDYGIQVLGSAILFLDHHNKNNIQDDIDFVLDLETDFVQFMNLGPLPGTALYEKCEQEGTLRYDLPFEEWHGQNTIWFNHPNFTLQETAEYLKDAFEQDYQKQGPSLLRLAETALRGYLTFKHSHNPRLQKLQARMANRCNELRYFLPVALRFAENNKTRELSKKLIIDYEQTFGKLSLNSKLISLIISLFAKRESELIRKGQSMRQPPLRKSYYRMPLWQRSFLYSLKMSGENKSEISSTAWMSEN